MSRCGISFLWPIHYFWSPINEVIILWSCSRHAISSVGKLAGVITLRKPTWLIPPSHWYERLHRFCLTKLATTAGVCSLIARPQSTTCDIMAQKMVQLREVIRFHARTSNIFVGTAGRWRGNYWQRALRFLVQFIIAQLHKSATAATRLRPAATIFDMLGMFFCREDQFTVLTCTWTATALVILK